MPGLLAVVTPAPTSQLTTVAAARADCGIGDSSQDSLLGTLIDRASSIISDHCGGRAFGATALSETFRFGTDLGIGPASQTVAPYGTPINARFKPLILSCTPVVAITSITENGNALSAGTDYEVDAGAGLVWRLRGGYRSWFNIPTVVVAYTAGYALPNDTRPAAALNIPATLENACLALVRSAYLSQGFDMSVVMDWSPEIGRTQYQRGSASSMVLDDGLQSDLAPYVLRVF